MQVVQTAVNNSLRNFTYLLKGESGDVYAIDPWSLEILEEDMRHLGGALKGIINTHEHHDHVMGNEAVKAKYQVPIYAHKNAKNKIEGVDHFLGHGNRISIGENEYLEVLDTPGHTHAHLCFLAHEDSSPLAIFTGDTLFQAGVGNCHNGGDPEVLYETIRDQFLGLPDDLLVYTGHDYLEKNLGFTLDREPLNNEAKIHLEKCKQGLYSKNYLITTIGLEKKINVFLRFSNEVVKKNLGDVNITDKEAFVTLRKLRNNW